MQLSKLRIEVQKQPRKERTAMTNKQITTNKVIDHFRRNDTEYLQIAGYGLITLAAFIELRRWRKSIKG